MNMGIWQKLKKAVWGEKAAVNMMNVSTLAKMRREVAKSGVLLSNGDIRGVGVRENVGVVVSQGAADDLIQKAVQAFIKAADTLDLDMRRVPRDNVPVYIKDNTPTCE